MKPEVKTRSSLWVVGALAAGLITAATLVRSELPRLLPRGGAPAEASQVRPPAQDYTSGAYLYRTFCASCHGSGGRGDGPVADTLRQRLPDLTTISARRGGTFPRTEIYGAIDGRRPMAGHGGAEMPVWGDVLRATEGQDDAIIKRRIDALVQYVESLQAK
jgi:mono/diheme cytochrome c family protein